MWKRVILAGVLGGIAMFVWSSVAHMATPLGGVQIKELPNEQAVLAALQQHIGNAWGLYKVSRIRPRPERDYVPENGSDAAGGGEDEDGSLGLVDVP